MTTLKISIYAGILISLPVLLYQAYAFMLPALKPTEKRVVLPFLLLVPVLFVAGVVFAYFVVVPAATKFLLNFNEDQFNIQVRASEYYSFVILTLIALAWSSRCRWDRRGHPPRHRHPEAARQQPPLRVPDPGRDRHASARHRSGDHADRAGAPAGVVRVLARLDAPHRHAVGAGALRAGARAARLSG